MTEKMAKREIQYQAALSTAKEYRAMGLLSAEQYRQFDQYLREKYQPILIELYQKDNLTNRAIRANVDNGSLQIKSQPLRAKNLRRQRSVRHENDKKTTQEGGQTEVAQPSRRVKDKRPSAVPTASLTRRAVYAHGQSRGWFPTPVNQG